MLDTLTKIFSIATLGILFLMALLNIGYFYMIGFHFIGVIDISNIVYTFGLGIVFVLLFAFVGGMCWFVFGALAELIPTLHFKGKLLIAVCVAGLIVPPLIYLFRQQGEAELKALAVAAPLFGFMVGIAEYHRWKSTGAIELVPALFACLLVSLGMILVGAVLARQQLTSTDMRYDLITKSGAFVGARILRSSSAGFIFAHEGRILFVPSGEVRLLSTPEQELK